MNMTWMMTLFLFAGFPTAQDHCSLIVTVDEPAGRGIGVDVTVMTADGRKVRKGTVPGDDGAKFCDLGILPVTVVVGNEMCSQVILRNVQLQWSKTTTSRVFLDRSRCMIDGPPPPVPVCEVFLQVRDPNDDWVNKATVSLKTPFEGHYATDKYGRVRLLVKRETELTGSISIKGYRTQEFTVTCPRPSGAIERQIQLFKSP